MASKLRIFAEDFPSPTAIIVEWQEAGVVLFVDVCRSTFETAPPSVWLMQPSSTAPENLVTTLCVAPSSVTFRCSTFVPVIVGNVLILAIGDAYARPSSSAASHHPSPPFFGVCASLLPPAAFVREHGVDAFASFAFAWLCGPDVHAMRPHSRIGFACAVTLPSSSAAGADGGGGGGSVAPNASLWVHGGVPYVPKSGGRIPGADAFEPLAIGPELDAESDLFVVSGINASVAAANDKHLRKAVSEDFYGMFELKMCVSSESVSVWPWNRRVGLPLLCHHSLVGTTTTTSTQQQQQQQNTEDGGRYFSPSPNPTMRSGSTASASSPPLRTTQNNNNTRAQQHQHQPLFLIAFGGLRLTQWRCLRPDLLPQRNTEFVISNTFFVYDVAADAWEWRDSLAGTALAQTDAIEGGFPIVGPRPPPVFEHKIVSCVTPILALEKNEQAEDGSSSSSSPSSQQQRVVANCQETTFVISGGLRGRFSEKSKELWCFSPQLPKHIECCQQTGPPSVPTHLFSFQQLYNNPQEVVFDDGTVGYTNVPDEPRMWALDLRAKKMWHRRASILETGMAWDGPVSVVNGHERGRSIDLDHPPPVVVHIPQATKPSAAGGGGGGGGDAAAATAAQVAEAAATKRSSAFSPLKNNDNDDGGGDVATTATSSKKHQQQPRRDQSPNTAAFVMDAFEFG